MIRIKVCGMVYPENVIEIAAVKPDLMGFIFYPGSKRFVGADPDPAVFKGVPEEIIKTGVFVDEKPEIIKELVRKFRLDMVQLHGDESPGECETLKSSGIKVIKTFGISGKLDFRETERYADVCDYFLFDSGKGAGGGSGQKFIWSALESYHASKPFFLSGGIGGEDAGLIKSMGMEKLYAVDINSRFESAPGMKERYKVESFIKEIRK